MINSRIFLIVILLLLSSIAMCQSSSVLSIAYRNCNDYKNEKPLFKTSFKFIPKQISEFHDEYKVKSNQEKISNQEIKYGIWIIKNDENIYVNGARQGLQCSYLKFNTGQRYYYFIAKPMYNASEQARINNSAIIFGAAGAIVASIKIDIENQNKLHHVFDITDGIVHYLTKDYILDILQDYPYLLEDFKNTENNSSIEVLKAFLEIINGLQ